MNRTNPLARVHKVDFGPAASGFVDMLRGATRGLPAAVPFPALPASGQESAAKGRAGHFNPLPVPCPGPSGASAILDVGSALWGVARPVAGVRRKACPVFLALAAALSLAGCATPDVGTDVATTGMPNAELALRESMRLVDAEMSKLGTMGPAPVQRFAGPVLPGELQKMVFFSWAGTLEDGVRKLADSIGYAVAVASPPGGNGPAEVGVATGQVPILQAFQALGEAAGSRAMVRVDPARRQVDVVYRA